MSDVTPGQFKRCFFSGLIDHAGEILIRMLTDRGIAVSAPWTSKVSSPVSQEILGLISSSDFVVATVGASNRDNTMYELGVARSLGKPAFLVLLGGTLPSDLSGVYVRAIESDRITDVANDLNIFLRNAKAPRPITSAGFAENSSEMGWAREELKALRATNGPRERDFETLVRRIFISARAEVTQVEAPGPDGQIDFVVWLNEVAYEAGGPILVECKMLRGGSGSVIKNAEVYAKRLERAVDSSDASLAMLIIDHERPPSLSAFFETPKVLSFGAETLIDLLEKGTLQKEILDRRKRAAFIQGSKL